MINGFGSTLCTWGLQHQQMIIKLQHWRNPFESMIQSHSLKHLCFLATKKVILTVDWGGLHHIGCNEQHVQALAKNKFGVQIREKGATSTNLSHSLKAYEFIRRKTTPPHKMASPTHIFFCTALIIDDVLDINTVLYRRRC